MNSFLLDMNQKWVFNVVKISLNGSFYGEIDQMPRKKVSSPEAFQQALQKRQHLYKHPKGESNPNPFSMTLIGVDEKGKSKEERVYLPKWRVDTIELRFKANQKALINLNDVRRQLKG